MTRLLSNAQGPATGANTSGLHLSVPNGVQDVFARVRPTPPTPPTLPPAACHQLPVHLRTSSALKVATGAGGRGPGPRA